MPQPNTSIAFTVVDDTQPPLTNSPSPLIPSAWRDALITYPGDLGETLFKILRYGVRIGYEGPLQRLISTNQPSANNDLIAIQSQLDIDLSLLRVMATTSSFPYISSPLGLVPKHDGSWRRIHNLSHPENRSVNHHIPDHYATITYPTLAVILDMVLKGGRGCYIVKKDIKEAFRIVPVSPQDHWLLGFTWLGTHYVETCLPFGLCTAPVLFNLFAEAIEWMLKNLLSWHLITHYLDDFIRIVPPSDIHTLPQSDLDFARLTKYLGLVFNDSKNRASTTEPILGIEVDTIRFEARLPREKLAKAVTMTTASLRRGSFTLREAQKLAGFLQWCSQVIRLGRPFMSSLWETITTLHSLPLGSRRRIDFCLRQDLVWWQNTLPEHNGILFFDDLSRSNIQLFTDACPKGLGGFFYLGSSEDWRESIRSIHRNNSFSTRLSSAQRYERIEKLEVQAILVSIQRWTIILARSHLVVHTDNTAAYLGLRSGRLHGPANTPLREVLCLAARHDITLESRWLSSADNALADALSRDDTRAIANFCTHWQDPSL